MKIQKREIFLLPLAICLSILASSLAGFDLIMKVKIWPIILWVAGIVLLIIVEYPRLRTTKINNKIPVICFLLLTLAAFYWRIVDTAHIPVSLSGDEGSAALFASSFLNGLVTNPFTLGWYSFPTMFSFIQSFGIAVFGKNIFALRFLTALIGSLTVGTIYWLGKELFNQKIGLWAGILAVGLAFQIHFSRIALNNIWDGLSFCVAITTAWLGWKKENKFFFMLSGMASGFSLYFYESSKVLILLLFIWFVCLVSFDFHKAKRCLPGLLLFLTGFFVAFIPLLRFYLAHFDTVLAHGNKSIFSGEWMSITMERDHLSEAAIIIKQVFIGLGAYISVPLDYFYKPGTALLLPVEAAIFCLGSLFCLRHIRDPRSKLILLWIILFGLLGGFTENAPSAQRYVAAAPVAVLVTALGLYALEKLLLHFLPKWRLILNLVILFSTVILCFNELYFYFLKYTPKSDYGGRGAEIETQLAENFNKIPGDKNVYYWGYPVISYGSLQVLPFLAPNATGYDMDQFNNTGSLPPIPNGKNKFFVFLDEKADFSQIESAFPGGTLIKGTDKLGNFLFWQYSVTSPQ